MHHLCRPTTMPQVRDAQTDELRDARAGERLNFGLVLVDAEMGLYDHAHSDREKRPPWCNPVIEGPTSTRYGRLPKQIEGRVLRARAYRAQGHAIGEDLVAIERHLERRRARGQRSRIQEVTVPIAELEPTDLVLESGLPAHRWAGEPVR